MQQVKEPVFSRGMSRTMAWPGRDTKIQGRIASEHYLLRYAPNPCGPLRLLVRVAKKQVAKAVWRNRIRRIWWEACRALQLELKHYDLAVVVTKPIHMRAQSLEVQVLLERLLTKVTVPVSRPSQSS